MFCVVLLSKYIFVIGTLAQGTRQDRRIDWGVCGGECGKGDGICRQGGGEKRAGEADVPFLGDVPLDPRVAECGDAGDPIVHRYPETPIAKAYLALATEVAIWPTVDGVAHTGDGSVLGLAVLVGREVLLGAALGLTASLIPGSLIVEVDRYGSTLYLHVLNTPTHRETQHAIQAALDIEELLIRAIGSRRDLRELS